MPNNSVLPRIRAFLDKIAKVESSGANPSDFSVEHPVIQTGLQRGQQAIGAYGLLPNTIDEMIERMRRERSASPELRGLEGLDKDELQKTFDNRPDLYQKITDRLAQHVFRDTKDPEVAAYRWNTGHNLPLESITPDKLDSNPYVQKFKHINDTITRKPAAIADSLAEEDEDQEE